MRGQRLVEEKRRYLKIRRTCWRLFFGAVILLAALLTYMYLASQGPDRGERFITRLTEHTFRLAGQEVPVELYLEPRSLPDAPEVPEGGRRLDVLIGLDNSLSMTFEGTTETALERVRKVVSSFLDATDLERHQVGLVRLDQEARVVQGLSRNLEVLKRIVQELPEGQGTKVGEGLAAMGPEFSSIRRQPGSLALAILLTDGRTNARALRSAAESLADQQGIFVAPIGIGDGVTDDLLRAVSSFPSEYAKGVGIDELTAIYRRWLANMEQLVAVDVRITETINTPGLELVAGTASDDATVTGKRIEWYLPFLTTAPRSLHYRLDTGSVGWWCLDEPQGSVSLRPVGAGEVTFPIHRKPKVIVSTFLLWLLLPLLLLLLLLPWLLAWWRRCQAAAGPARLPAEIEAPPPPRMPPPLPALDLAKLVRSTEPTLIIGLGGAGRWALTFLKKAVLETNYGRMPETLQFLVFDTHGAEMREGSAGRRVQVGGVELNDDELILLHEDPEDPTALFDRTRRMAEERDADPHLQDWWPADHFKNLPVEQLQISRGTNQRRPLGRMALYLDLENGPEASRLWSSIGAAVRRLKEHGDPTVFISASASGGTGGGMFIDVAYLTRKISHAEGAKGVTLNLLLALQNTFAADSLVLTAPNAFAAMKELDLFLACRDRRLPMIYSQDPSNPANGRLDSPLLDNCYFFDARREHYPLVGEPPERGIYPAMADAIHTFLYTTPGGAFDQELKQRKAVSEFEREESGHGVVSSLGTFVFRLPMYEFLQSLKYRFARELAAEYFGVVRDESGHWAVLPLSEEEEQAALKALEEFLYLSGEDRSPVDVLQSIAASDPEWLFTIVEADNAYKAREDYLRIHACNARRHLAVFAMRLLNSDPESERSADDPGKRFTATTCILRHLHKRIAIYRSQCQGFSGATFRGTAAAIVDELLSVYESTAQQIVQSLEAHRDGILGSPDTEKESSLLTRLERQEQRQLESRKLESDVLVREYFYSEELEEKIYRDYLSEATRTNSLKRFVWHCHEEAGGLATELKLMADEVHELKPYGEMEETSARTLTELAELILQPMWDMDIHPYIQKAHPDPAALADMLYERANPFIEIDRSKAVRHTVKLFTTLVADSYADEVLTQLYPKFARQQHVRVTEFKDPHCFSTVIIMDSLPLPSLRAYEQAEKAYLSVPEAHRPSLHILAAEHIAARLEQRLPDVKERKRALHPRFISYLAHEESTRCFAECMIYGVIPNALAILPGNLRLELDDAAIELLDEDHTKRSSSPWLEALDRFTRGKGADGTSIAIDQCVKRVSKAKRGKEDLAAFLAIIEDALIRLKAKRELPEPERDLLSYISLVVWDEKRK